MDAPRGDRPLFETVKRLIDVAGASVCLVVLSPLLLGIAGCILAIEGRPILFRQDRPGRAGNAFSIIKFRTMRVDGGSEPASDAARLSRFGKFLRSWSLDELPELWNIFVGDMSFVGPRPLLMQYLPLYSPRQARRHEVRPGLTGWAQINGRNSVTWEQKFELDVWYVDNRSLWLDIRILLATVSKVLRREAISAADHATIAPFTGPLESGR